MDGKQGSSRGRYPLISVLTGGGTHEACVVFVAVCSLGASREIWQQIAGCLAGWGREIHGAEWSVRRLLADRAQVIDEGFRAAGFEGFARGSCLPHVIRNCDERLVNVGIGKGRRVVTLAEIRTIGTCASEEQLLLCGGAYVDYWMELGEGMKKFAAYFPTLLRAPSLRGWFAGAQSVGVRGFDVSCEQLDRVFKKAYASQMMGLVPCCRALQARILPGLSVGRKANPGMKPTAPRKIQEIAKGVGEAMLVVGDVGYVWSAQGASSADRPFFTAADLVDRQELSQKGKLTKDEADQLLMARVITADSCSCSHYKRDAYCSHYIAFARKVGMSPPGNITLAESRIGAAGPVRAKLSAAKRRELQNVQKSHICGVCNRWCGNSANLKSHEAGKAHRDVLARLASSLIDNAAASDGTDPGGYEEAGDADSGQSGETSAERGRLTGRREQGDGGENWPHGDMQQGDVSVDLEASDRKRRAREERPSAALGRPKFPRRSKDWSGRANTGPPRRIPASLRNKEYDSGHWLTGVEIILAESVFANHASFKSVVAKNYFGRHMLSAMRRRSASNEYTNWGGVWVVNSEDAGRSGRHWAAVHGVWDEFGGVVVNVVDSLSGEVFERLSSELNARANVTAHLHGLGSQQDEWSCGYHALYFALQMSECAGKGGVFDLRSLSPMPRRFVDECNDVLATCQKHGECPRRQWR